MTADLLVLIVLVLAAVPCGLFVLNLLVYRPLPRKVSPPETPVSVLIPARNEASNIQATVQAALASQDVAMEVVVLDDHSTDRTAEIVAAMARNESRLRLEQAPPLPGGWCGKQHACSVLAGRARYPLLVFLDADVRLEPDALARMVAFMERRHSSTEAKPYQPASTSPMELPGGVSCPRLDGRPALASGVPRQDLGTVSERMLIPLIHFILLGFLPMHFMRRTRLAAFSAGCGQLFIAWREAYRRCHGHAGIRTSLHDGLQLPRHFRRSGFATDLFDATDLATCRMYRANREVWFGLGKNATEGLAAPTLILPFTLLLLGGQVLPFVLLMFLPELSVRSGLMVVAAVLLVWIPRMAALRRFRQPLSSALLHPIGITALVWIQWFAFLRWLVGRPARWKGRIYASWDDAPPPAPATES